jgi:hypothetical protein
MIQLIRDFLVQKNILKLQNNCLEDLFVFFEYLVSSKEKFNSAYLLNYLYSNISAKDVAKRKTTARDFEDFLATLFNGTVTDEFKRENKNIETKEIFVENEFITKFVLSNKREKADLIFDEGYQLSVKTLIASNTEINLGSFEKTALFYLLDVEDYLNERKGKRVKLNNNEIIEIGLGSRSLLKNLLKLLEVNNKFETFKSRFIKMSEVIFSDDLIIAIKNDLMMDLYFVKGQDFIDLLNNIIKTPEDFLRLVNRWEGNTIRVDRAKILNIAKHIHLDFHFLEMSFLKYFQNFEDSISKLLVMYINTQSETYKELIFEEIEKIMTIIDQNREVIN